MPRYLVSCDLNTPGRDYQPLHDELARLGATRILLSQWVLRNAATEIAIRDHLWTFMDGNDRLLVSSLDDRWASNGVMTPINDI
jgi:hypothetical protein